MGQGNGAAESEVALSVRNVHVTSGVATSISTDGTVGMLKFTDAAGGEFALTFPLPGGLNVLSQMVFDLVTQARNRAAGPGNISPRFPATMNVGHSDGVRNCVLVTIDPGMPTEVVYAIPDDAALPFADAIRQNVLTRKTPAERSRLLSGVALPGGRIILPGR